MRRSGIEPGTSASQANGLTTEPTSSLFLLGIFNDWNPPFAVATTPCFLEINGSRFKRSVT